MAGRYAIRWHWLRAMYILTAIVAGGFGLGMVVAPVGTQSVLDMPAQDPVTFGLGGSVFLAFGVVAIVGIRAPLKYCPILLVELAYKLIWLLGVVVPVWLQGKLPGSAMVQVAIFVVFVLGDLVAIPLRYVFGHDIALPEGGNDRAP
jgi:hypothetical protein